MQFKVFAVELIESDALIAGDASPTTGIDLCFARPRAQGLARAADFGRNRANRFPLGSIFAFVIEDHPHDSSADLGEYFLVYTITPHLSRK